MMMMWRGFYWNVFEGSHGFFSANRLSAIAAFALVYFLSLFIALGLTFHEVGSDARRYK